MLPRSPSHQWASSPRTQLLARNENGRLRPAPSPRWLDHWTAVREIFGNGRKKIFFNLSNRWTIAYFAVAGSLPFLEKASPGRQWGPGAPAGPRQRGGRGSKASPAPCPAGISTFAAARGSQLALGQGDWSVQRIKAADHFWKQGRCPQPPPGPRQASALPHGRPAPPVPGSGAVSADARPARRTVPRARQTRLRSGCLEVSRPGGSEPAALKTHRQLHRDTTLDVT